MRRHSLRTSLCVALVVGLASSAWAAGDKPVVSNTYENFDKTNALTNVPVTLSRIGAAGDFTKGITPVIDGLPLPAQVDVLRRADDKSIRHALVSFVLPELPAGGKVKIDWFNAKPQAPEPFKWGFDKANFAAKLILQPEDGEAITSDVGKIMAGGWAASKRVKVLYDGAVMKEFEIHDIPVTAAGDKDNRIEVFWRLRVFTGEKSVRIAAVVENCKDRVKGRKHPFQYKFSSVKLFSGDKMLYREGPIDHLDQTRYRILVWTAGALEDIHRRPNYEYWIKGKFIPKYRFTNNAKRAYQNLTAKKVDKIFTTPRGERNRQKRLQAILEPGMIHRHMPGTGGRWEMEPYPAWTVGYLLSGAPKTYRAILHADGNGSGAFFMHVRQDGAPGYDIRTVKQPAQASGYRHNLYRLPDGKRTPVQPDHAHAPSLGYVAYLLTGDKYYAEEASFWAAYQAGEWPHKGLRWKKMDRSFAYGLRHVVDAAFILPDDHPLKAYFTWAVRDCMRQMNEALVQSGRKVHSQPGDLYDCSGRANWINCRRMSAWMYSWVVWSLGNTADKGFPEAVAVRDWAAEYIVGLYTSKDEFKAPDGKVYRYDPADAMPYSTATTLWEWTYATTKDGKKRIKLGKKIKDLENYGEIWYYTKLNEDNSYHGGREPTTAPDAKGNWPLRERGWGHGNRWDANKHRTARWWAWHRYGAWPGITVALEAGVPNSKEAWATMASLAGGTSYGYEMLPRNVDLAPLRAKAKTLRAERKGKAKPKGKAKGKGGAKR